jgi:hypothetical protein
LVYTSFWFSLCQQAQINCLQHYYHIPSDWLISKKNLLTVFYDLSAPSSRAVSLVEFSQLATATSSVFEHVLVLKKLVRNIFISKDKIYLLHIDI